MCPRPRIRIIRIKTVAIFKSLWGNTSHSVLLYRATVGLGDQANIDDEFTTSWLWYSILLNCCHHPTYPQAMSIGTRCTSGWFADDATAAGSLDSLLKWGHTFSLLVLFMAITLVHQRLIWLLNLSQPIPFLRVAIFRSPAMVNAT